MPSFLSKIHRHIKQKHCDLGHCTDTIKSNRKSAHNTRLKKILNNHKNYKVQLNNPSTFYTSGIYGTNNCNTSMNHLPRKTKSDLALESVDNVINNGGSPIEGQTHIINKCNIETFDNKETFDNNYIILITLIILIVICLICCIWCNKLGK